MEWFLQIQGNIQGLGHKIRNQLKSAQDNVTGFQNNFFRRRSVFGQHMCFFCSLSGTSFQRPNLPSE